MTLQDPTEAWGKAEPIVLSHTWPLCDRSLHFDFGHVLSSVVTDTIKPAKIGELAPHHAGCWECDLSNNALFWSGGVYDIFGLPRGTDISRDKAVTFYSEESRAKMERLRAYSIKHRRGFTLDVEIRTPVGEERLMRVIAVPVCTGNCAVRLHGLKVVI